MIGCLASYSGIGVCSSVEGLDKITQTACEKVFGVCPLLIENHAHFCINNAAGNSFFCCINEEINGTSSKALFCDDSYAGLTKMGRGLALEAYPLPTPLYESCMHLVSKSRFTV